MTSLSVHPGGEGIMSGVILMEEPSGSLSGATAGMGRGAQEGMSLGSLF